MICKSIKKVSSSSINLKIKTIIKDMSAEGDSSFYDYFKTFERVIYRQTILTLHKKNSTLYQICTKHSRYNRLLQYLEKLKVVNNCVPSFKSTFYRF